MDNHFFTANRRILTKSLNTGLIVLSGWTAMQWHSDTAQPFRQEANFWYLTGIKHANWQLVIDGKQGESWLIGPDVDPVHQIFDGSLDFATAKTISGVDAVIDQMGGQQLLKDLAKKHSTVHTVGEPSYAKYVDFSLNPAPKQLHKRLEQLFSSVQDCQKEFEKLRAIKQPLEIEAMGKAAKLTAEALVDIKTKLPVLGYEYEVEAELTYRFRRHNALHAFEPIVASGKNACTLHYVSNSSVVQPGQLLLIDTGAQIDGYPADITRTLAIGEPTKRQVAVHLAVQLAERRIIELIKPGFSLKEYVAAADAIMKDALLSLELMKNRNDKAAYRRYFPHAISHGLGLDVHESLGGYKEFRPGMVLTVEPGIYIPEEGIGVRIEDDILVTDGGQKNLSAGLSTDL